MIRLEELHCGYGPRDVLHGISLRIEAGENVGLLGPNGSGKTTLLAAVSGLVPARQGRVLVDGEDTARLSSRQRARRMAAVPQSMDRPREVRVEHLVLMGRYPHISFLAGYTTTDREAARRAMEATRTLVLARRACGELSGGEMQRVLLGRALAQEAPVLLLDEATSGLDIARKVDIQELLAVRNARGVTVVSAIHDLNLAALYCRRLIFLKEGRVVLDGAPDEVFTAENLSEIYETGIDVLPHPRTGSPQALLAPDAAVAARRS